jgi:DNA-binding MarR family transcriptional regulator
MEPDIDYTEILIKIRQIVRSINLESKKIQKTHGVSIPQILCLSYLRKKQNYQSTQNDIRKFLNLNSSTVTGIINRLENKGFIARLPKSGDKRTTRITLTSAGDELLQQIPPLLHDRLSSKLKNMSENKISDIEKSLDLLIGLLEIDSKESFPFIASEDNI